MAESSRGEQESHTCVADTGVCDFDSDLVGLWRCDLNILVAELLSGAPGDGGLADDGLRITESASHMRCDHDRKGIGWLVGIYKGQGM